MWRRTLVATAAVAAVWWPPSALLPTAAGQEAAGVSQPPAVFRANTRLVVQTVTVRDAAGNPVEGLTAQDFVVTENGQPQDVAFAQFVRLPAPTDSAAARPAGPQSPTGGPATPEAAAPPVGAAATRPAGVPGATLAGFAPPPAGDVRFRDRRLLVLYFDLSAMPPGDQARAYRAAFTYVDTQMGTADLLALVTYEGGSVRVKQDFTADRAALRESLAVLLYGEDKDGDGVRDQPDPSSAFGQGDAEFNIFNTDRQLAAMQTVVTMLRSFAEQKALVYFGSGLRLNGTDNTAQLRATTNAAIRSNVTIHPVDARGLVAQAPLGDATQRSPGGIGMFTGQLATAGIGALQRSQDALYALAKDTGGTVTFDSNDLSEGIARAAGSIVSYYLLGYYSTHSESDGKFRRVTVALANGKVGALSYRQGYYGDKTFAKLSGVERERQLEEALLLDNPITDIPIALEVNYFQLNRAEYFVPVAVKIPGSELALARRRGAQRTVIDFIGEVKDDFGVTMQNVRDKLDIKLSDQAAADLASRPIQYETGFTLLPGKYVIKFLARDAEAGRIGTYQTSFTVPNLNREERMLPVSSVVLGSQRVALGAELFTVKTAGSPDVHPLVHDGQKLLPSVTRVFSASRDLHVYLQAYERGATATQPLVAYVTLYRNQDKVFESAPTSIVDGLDPRSKSVPVRLSVSLSGVAPGRYDCQVTVLEPTSQKVAFWRAPIAVVN